MGNDLLLWRVPNILHVTQRDRGQQVPVSDRMDWLSADVLAVIRGRDEWNLL